MNCAKCRFITWNSLDSLGETSGNCGIKFPPWMNLPSHRVVFPDNGDGCDFGEPEQPTDNHYSWR